MTATTTTFPDWFREFYSLVAETRRALERSPTSPEAQEVAANLQSPVLDLLAHVESENETSGASDTWSISQLRYLLAAYADDRLADVAGDVAAAWRSHGIERRLFGTDDGGLEVFRRLERVLEVGDPGQRPLAEVYLLALSLGFRGSPSDATADRARDGYRQRLTQLLALPSTDAGQRTLITASAYRHTLATAEVALLPNVRFWGWLAFAALGLMLMLSFFTWQDAMAPLIAAVERVLRL